MVQANVGDLDARIRNVLGGVFVLAAIAGFTLGGTAGLIVGIVGLVFAAIMFVTAKGRVCPIYLAARLSTAETNEPES